MRQWRSPRRTLRQVRVVEAPLIRFLPQVCSLSNRSLEARRRRRSTQRLISCCGVTSLQEFREKRRPRARAFPLARMRRRRPRTSSPTRTFENGAATAYEPEPQTVHNTDNQAKSCSRSWICWTLPERWRQSAWRTKDVQHTWSRRWSNTCERGEQVSRSAVELWHSPPQGPTIEYWVFRWLRPFPTHD